MVSVMKLRNSVGGQRIYPTSPEEAEMAAMAIGIIGQFNEGMDRFNRERTLTEQQHQLLVQRQNLNTQLARCYRMLTALSDRFWQLALEKQQFLNLGLIDGPYTTKELGQLLIRFADLWKGLKRRLDDQA